MGYSDAGGAISRTDWKRMDKHAEMYYEEIRKRRSDTQAIARNTGFTNGEIEKIKRHLFIETHDLGKKTRSRFMPDYDIAVSWQRLIDGKQQEMDIVLLNHELMELKLMSEGYVYEEAHDLADSLYNYTKYVKELDAKEGLF